MGCGLIFLLLLVDVVLTGDTLRVQLFLGTQLVFVLCRMWFRGYLVTWIPPRSYFCSKTFGSVIGSFLTTLVKCSQFFPFIYKIEDFGNVLRVLCDAIQTVEVMGKKIS